MLATLSGAEVLVFKTEWSKVSRAVCSICPGNMRCRIHGRPIYFGPVMEKCQDLKEPAGTFTVHSGI